MMRLNMSLLVAALAFSFAQTVQGAYSPGVQRAKDANRPLRLLVIGNSFSQRITIGGSYLRFGEVSRNLGHGVDVVSLYRAGGAMGNWTSALNASITNINGVAYFDLMTSDLATKFTTLFGSSVTTGEVVQKSKSNNVNVSLRQILSEGDWDVVTIQQSSGMSGGDYAKYWQTSGATLLAAIREEAPDAEIKFHQTWSYDRFSNAANDSNGYQPEAERGSFGGNVFRRDQMYDRIAANVKRLTSEHAAANPYGTFAIIPSGYAVQHYRYNLPVRTKASDPTNGDGQHLGSDYLYLQMVVWLKHFWDLADADVPAPAAVKSGYAVAAGTEQQQKESALAAAAQNCTAGSSAFDYYGQGTIDYSYDVTFASGYDSTPVVVQSVTNAACATVPTPAPTRTGYTFLGWSANGTDIVAAATIGETPVYDDKTYTALWEQGGEPTPPSPHPTDGIWVAQNGDNDSGDGSYANPYATITFALTKVDAGGTIYVKAGTIAEAAAIDITKSVTIAGDPDASRENVVLTGGSAHRVFLVNGASVALSGLTVADGYVTTDYYGGGGVSCRNGGVLVVSNCVFRGNQSTTTSNDGIWRGNGGAISCCKGDNGNKRFDNVGTVHIYGSAFADNKALRCAGAVFGAQHIENSTFASNNVSQTTLAASVGSSTIHLNSAATVRNCLLVGNGTYNGGNRISTASYNLIGIAPFAVTIESCTFVRNGACSGVQKASLIYAHNNDYTTMSVSALNNVTVRNCLFNDNTIGTSTVNALSGTIGGTTRVAAPTSALSGATENNLVAELASDARFADVSHGDYTPQASWTAVVDAGANQSWMNSAKDLMGRTRIINGTVDIGAYEHSSYVPVDLSTATVTFDPASATYDGTKHEPSVTVMTNGLVVTQGFTATWDDPTLTEAKTYTLTLTADGVIFKVGTVKTATFVIAAAPTPPSPHPTDGIWVAEDGDDNSGNGTYETPYATISHALAQTANKIYIKEGTIAESAQINVTKSVTIAGDPDVSRDDVVVSGSNAHRVFLVNGASVTLSGLTISDGLVVSDINNGGGAYCQGNGTLVVTNCVFSGNRSTHATSNTKDCKKGQGGAISCLTRADDDTVDAYVPTGVIRAYDSAFLGNAATFCAGAVLGATEVVNCRFQYNNILQTIAGISVGSSALYLGANATVRNCLFANNGTYNGGTAHTASYNLIGLANTAATVENCTFVHNGNRSDVMKSCLIFSHKTATDVANPSTSTNLTIRNCLFNDNTVGTSTYTTLFGSIGKVTSPNIPAIAPSGAQNAASCNNLVVELAADARFQTDGHTPMCSWQAVVDAGANQSWMADAKDLAGNDRIYDNGTVDIGAYEYVGKAAYTGGENKVPVAYDDAWLAEAGVMTGDETAAQVQTKLDTPNANGITPSDAYLLGYAANEAATAAIVLKPVQTADASKVRLTATGLPSASSRRAGAEVSYEAHYSAKQDMSESVVVKDIDPAGVDLDLPASGVRYYRVRAVITMPE